MHFAVTGRRFKSREDVRDFLIALEARRRDRELRALERWRLIQRSTLLVLLALAVAQYVALDTLLQVMSLPELTVFVPVTPRDVRPG